MAAARFFLLLCVSAVILTGCQEPRRVEASHEVFRRSPTLEAGDISEFEVTRDRSFSGRGHAQLSDEGWRFRPCGEQVWLPLDSYEDHQQALEDQLTRGEGVVYVEAIFRHQAEGYRLSMLSFADGSGPPCATEDEDYELWLENPDEGWRLVINDGDTRASGFPGLNAKKYNGPFWACDISFSVVYAEERPQLAWTLKDEPCFDARGNWHRFHADVAVGSMNYQGCGRQGRGIDDIGSGCSF